MRLLDIHEIYIHEYTTGGYEFRGKLSVFIYGLGISLTPNFEGLLVLLLPFPVVTLNDEILLLLDEAAAVWLRTDQTDAEGAGGCQASKDNLGTESEGSLLR